MIIVDTSVWIEHFRTGNARLAAILEAGQAVVHAFVLGELALGNISRRAAVLDDLRNLPQAPMADDNEVLVFIEKHRLHGSGIGYVDAHLLASAHLAGIPLLTRDKRLHETAFRLKCSA